MESNTTIVPQVLYRAFVDTRFAQRSFEKIPVTDENFGIYKNVAEYVKYHYSRSDEPLGADAIKVLIEQDLRATNKFTTQNFMAMTGPLDVVVQTAQAENYSNSDEIREATNKWVNSKRFTEVIMRALKDNDVTQPDKLEGLADSILNIAKDTSGITKGDFIDFFGKADQDRRVDLLKNMYANPSPTYFRDLDSQMEGGLAPGEMGLIIAPSGAGKAEPLTARIPTPGGIKFMGEIKVGDMVYDRQGHPTEVVGVYDQGTLDAYEVTTSDGRKGIYNGEHLFSYWTRHGNKSSKGRIQYLKTKTLNEMMKTGLFWINKGEFWTRSYRYHIPVAPAVDYPEYDYEMSPYDVGVSLALEGTADGRTYVDKGTIGQRQKLVQGICDNIGHRILNSECELQKVTLRISNPAVVETITRILRSLGYEVLLREPDSRMRTILDIRGAFDQMTKLFSDFPEDVTKVSHAKGLLEPAIIEIKKLDHKVPMQCIYVDNPEHLYISSDYMVTHNTTMLCNLASNYIRYGKKHVLYIALEEKIARMVSKFIPLISGKSRKLLFDEDKHLKEDTYRSLDTFLSKLSEDGELGTLTIWKSQPQLATPNDIEEVVQNYMMDKGYGPDVVFVDYPDLLKNPHLRESVNESRAGGMVYEDLRQLADVYNYTCWVASQTNRSAYEQDVVNAYSLEGSKQKLNTVELCLSLNQKREEFQEGYIRFYLDKIRNPNNDNRQDFIYLGVDKSTVVFSDETEAQHENHLALIDAKQLKEAKADKAKEKREASRKQLQESMKIKEDSQ